MSMATSTSTSLPISKHFHDRCTKHFKGLSGQVKLFPVTFESGEGCVLRDVDGNEYIDFSSDLETFPRPLHEALQGPQRPGEALPRDLRVRRGLRAPRCRWQRVHRLLL